MMMAGNDRGERGAVIGDVFCDFKESARAYEDGGEGANAKDKSENDFAENVLV